MIKDTIAALRVAIQGRVFAYNRVFDPQNQYTRSVLKDLAKFCRAHKSTFHTDARTHAVLEGRREVWLRITEHLQLTEEDIFNLHVVKDRGETK